MSKFWRRNMTNLERLQHMDAAGAAAVMDSYAKSPARPYFDLSEWLESEDPDYPVRGRAAVYNGMEKCIIVEDKAMAGAPYRTALVPHGMNAYRLVTAPAEKFSGLGDA
ncbi:MAG: hypothetical protein NC311_19150 [Muribaculaceae bacterium]|nr:hypothetical protein [Muribaculaceae bacterium]